MLERQFAKKIQTGQDVVFDPSLPASDRRIDGTWLNALAAGPERKIAYPVRIKGAAIIGDIDLDYAEFCYGLEFESCEFRGQINLKFASVERSLRLERCRFRLPVNLRGLRAAGDLHLIRCVFHRGLWARDIEAGQDLWIEAGSIRGLHLSGMTYGNKVAGIMIRGAGPGNSVLDNTVVNNGRFGIDVQNTNEIRIEGNRVSYNRGYWDISPGGKQPGIGINLLNVNRAAVFDNRARGNSGVDVSWGRQGRKQDQRPLWTRSDGYRWTNKSEYSTRERSPYGENAARNRSAPFRSTRGAAHIDAFRTLRLQHASRGVPNANVPPPWRACTG